MPREATYRQLALINWGRLLKIGGKRRCVSKRFGDGGLQASPL